MLNVERILKNDRQLRAIIALDSKEFEILASNFAQILYEHFAKKARLRKVGGGRKGALRDAKSKLFYLLFYMKTYPTYDVAGFIFGVDRSKCCIWTKSFIPLLEKALGRTIVMPKRQVRSVEELLELCPEVKDLFIDATERRTQRPKKPKINKKRYSGKKKMHSRKNTIISDEKKRIIFVSKTKEGRIHDLQQLKKSGILEYIPRDKALWLDKGYQGIGKLTNNTIMMPHKKPKGKELTVEQKQENRLISGIRIVVEHAIGGIKRFGSMTTTYRNRKGQDDQMIYLCAALWNFHLQYS